VAGCDCHQYRPQLRGINAVRSALHEFYSSEEIDLWLDAPNPLLQSAAPNDLIATEFEDQVWALIDQLRSGAVV
jgi:uncharacterized protein (DUF2384 family)